MATNPYQTPDSDAGIGWGKPVANPEGHPTSWLARFQFGLKLPFLFVAAMLAGGQTARRIVSSVETGSRGMRVSLTVRGEIFFFTLGCLAAFAAILAIWKAPSLLRIRPPWRRRSSLQRSLVILVAAVVVGSFSALVAVTALGWVFFTMPRELSSLLYQQN